MRSSWSFSRHLAMRRYSKKVITLQGHHNTTIVITIKTTSESFQRLIQSVGN